MKSNYSFEKKDKYLELTISGYYDKQEFLAYPQLIKDECAKEGAYKVLVNALDVISTDATTGDRYYFGEEIGDVLGGKIKLAFVWPEKDINKFGETVAVNRGAFTCVFGDIETAEKWLLTVA